MPDLLFLPDLCRVEPIDSVEAHRLTICQGLRRCFPDADGAELDDCWQEVLLACFKHRDRLRQFPHSRFAAWLRRVARNVLLNWRRTRRARRAAETHFADRRRPELDAEGVAESIDDARLPDWLAEVLASQSHTDRAMLFCLFWQGKNQEETGQDLGLTRRSVNSRLARLLAKFRKKSRRIRLPPPPIHRLKRRGWMPRSLQIPENLKTAKQSSVEKRLTIEDTTRLQTNAPAFTLST